MAYIRTEQVAEMRKALKLIIPKTWKFSFTKSDHSSINLKILKSDVDLLKMWNQRHPIGDPTRLCFCALSVTNPNYSLYFTDEINSLFKQIAQIMSKGNFDHSDIMTDYFHIGWYAYIHIDTFNGYKSESSNLIEVQL